MSITYKQGDTTVASPTNAGSYSVTATLTNANYEATPATGTLVIGKATPSISWSNPADITYGVALGSTQLNASASHNGSSVAGSFAYTVVGQTGDAAGKVLNAGSHELKADFTPSNATNYTTASKTVQINVNKAQATISLSNLQHTYDGTAKVATATTNPAGLSGVSIFYSQNGQSVAAPTNAGSYDVVVSLDNNNYQAQNATGTLVISKATATLNLSGLSHTYNGTAKEATVTTNPAGLSGVSVTYDGSAAAPTSAGSYAVVASLDNNNYRAQDATGTLVISKANQRITFAALGNKTFGDAAFELSASASSGLAVSFSSLTTGVCTVADGTVTIKGAGTCTIEASQSGNANYNAATPVEQSFSIEKAVATITLSDLEHTYNGSAKAATATTTPAGLNVSISYSQNGQNVENPTNAGSYDVVAVISNEPNYKGRETGTLVIEKATATVNLGSLEHTYNGSAKTASATTVPAGLTVEFEYFSGATKLEGAPTNAGEYSVTGTVNDDNYKGSASSDEFKINKANQEITFAALGGKTYGDPDFRVSATGGDSGQPVTFAASPASVCSVAKNANGDWMVSIKGAGSCTITASQAGNDNYNAAADVARSFSVAKAAATIELSGLNHTYDGSAKSATASASSSVPAANTSVSGVSLVYSKDGVELNGAPTNAGTYSVTATLTNDNYRAADATGTLVISKANPVVTWANPADISYGTTLGSTQLNATASFKGETLAGTLDYTPAAGTLLNAGDNQTLSVTFTPNDSTNFHSASKDVAINVNKANQTINFTAISGKTFGDAEFQAFATGGASGNAVTFAVKAASNSKCTVTSAGMVTITGAGSCTLVASQAGNNNYNAAPDAEQTFNIAKAQAVVTLGNLTGHIYDGTAKAATAATNPAGLSVEITYNGSTTAPSAVGSYSVVATINDANYQGSTTGTLTIGAWTLKGFYSPVNMSTSTSIVWNTVKNGSTVPLKFEVFKGATELKETSAISGLTATKINCTTGAEDAIEVTATGSTSLRFDSTSDQFIYNWQTPKSLGCYSVTVTTNDGSTLKAFFSLK